MTSDNQKEFDDYMKDFRDSLKHQTKHNQKFFNASDTNNMINELDKYIPSNDECSIDEMPEIEFLNGMLRDLKEVKIKIERGLELIQERVRRIKQ